MTDHDAFCPWVDDAKRGPRDRCAWCDRLALARADATMVADQMLAQAKALADESQEALAGAIRIVMELRADVMRTAQSFGVEVTP